MGVFIDWMVRLALDLKLFAVVAGGPTPSTGPPVRCCASHGTKACPRNVAGGMSVPLFFFFFHFLFFCLGCGQLLRAPFLSMPIVSHFQPTTCRPAAIKLVKSLWWWIRQHLHIDRCRRIYTNTGHGLETVERVGRAGCVHLLFSCCCSDCWPVWCAKETGALATTILTAIHIWFFSFSPILCYSSNCLYPRVMPLVGHKFGVRRSPHAIPLWTGSTENNNNNNNNKKSLNNRNEFKGRERRRCHHVQDLNHDRERRIGFVDRSPIFSIGLRKRTRWEQEIKIGARRSS